MKDKKTKQNGHGYSAIQTIRKVGHVTSTGVRFCNGISNCYDTEIPILLQEILSGSELQKYSSYMRQLNKRIKQYWPCLFAFWCGYLCVPCTLGLSICVPRICISEV